MFKTIKTNDFSWMRKVVKIQWDKQATCLKGHVASYTKSKEISKAKL